MNQDINNGNNNDLTIEQNNNVAVNNSDPETIVCSNCAQTILKSSRCCMHCGQINYLNEANSSINKTFQKGEKIKEKEERKNKNVKVDTHSADAAFANKNGPTKKSKVYKTLKFIRNMIIVILLIAIIFNYKKTMALFNKFRSEFYLKQVDKMVEEIDGKLVNNNCISNDAGDMYYSFYISSDSFSTFVSPYTFNYFTGYIRVVPNGGHYDYYVTITDGKYGFKDQLYSEGMDYKVVQEIGGIEDIPETTIVCNEPAE